MCIGFRTSGNRGTAYFRKCRKAQGSVLASARTLSETSLDQKTSRILIQTMWNTCGDKMQQLVGTRVLLFHTPQRWYRSRTTVKVILAMIPLLLNFQIRINILSCDPGATGKTPSAEHIEELPARRDTDKVCLPPIFSNSCSRPKSHGNMSLEQLKMWLTGDQDCQWGDHGPVHGSQPKPTWECAQ